MTSQSSDASTLRVGINSKKPVALVAAGVLSPPRTKAGAKLVFWPRSA